MNAKKLAILAPSKLPMVRSKQLSVFCFFQGLLSLYNKDCLPCFIIRKSFSGVSAYCWAKINFKYSVKNIPAPTKNSNQLILMGKD